MKNNDIVVKWGEGMVTGFNAKHFSKMTEPQFIEEMGKGEMSHIFEGEENREAMVKETYATIRKKFHRPEDAQVVAETPAAEARPKKGIVVNTP